MPNIERDDSGTARIPASTPEKHNVDSGRQIELAIQQIVDVKYGYLLGDSLAYQVEWKNQWVHEHTLLRLPGGADIVEEYWDDRRTSRGLEHPLSDWKRQQPIHTSGGYADMGPWMETCSWEHIVKRIYKAERDRSGCVAVFFTINETGLTKVDNEYGCEYSDLCKTKFPKALQEFYREML
ncbi:hypothetical protein EUX98_g6155 [Antrodiella citrinella]|uniref:Chromo domain-containing protein n=1 Tax=Antrodiella citrinella TaxID=2447956 RepID=A0A4S4MX95_9APHY|nr:hypothetical protein EUX98_g6155 [Antrodiella citrinella]